MTFGTLGQASLSAAVYTTVYTVPTSSAATININVCNTSVSAGTIRLAVATDNPPVAGEFIEYNTDLPAYGAMERTGLVIGANKKIIAYADVSGVDVGVYGFIEPESTALETYASIAVPVHAATSKTTPVDADELALVDSADGWNLKKVTWTNVKTTLKTYFDTFYSSVSSLINPILQGYTLTGAETITYTAMSGTVVNVSLPGNTYYAASAATLTFSVSAPGAGTRTRLKITSDSQDRVITLPSVWSYNRNSVITTVTVIADSTLSLMLEYTGARWEVYGDPISNDLKVYTIGFSYDGGGATIPVGKVKGFATAKANGTIRAWNHTVDTGTPVIEVWKINTGTSKPSAVNTINVSGVGITTGTSVRSTSLSDFTTTTINQGDIVAFNIKSNSGGATEMSFNLEIVIS